MVYPPFYYLVLSPLSHLPIRTAVALWSVAMVSLLFVSLQWIRRLFQYPAWLFPLAVLYPPLVENLSSCQKGTVLLFLLTAVFALLRKQQHLAAGMVFGLVAFKPQLAIVIAVCMLGKRQWQFVIGGLLTGGTLVLLCLATGSEMCRQYVNFSASAAEYMQHGGYALTKSHSLYGSLALLLPGTTGTLVKVATLILGALVLARLVPVLRGPLRTQSTAFPRQYALMIIATLLLSPHLYAYDLTILLLPIVLLWEHCRLHPPATGVNPQPGRAQALRRRLVVAMFIAPAVAPILIGWVPLQSTVIVMFAVLIYFGPEFDGLRKANVEQANGGELLMSAES